MLAQAEGGKSRGLQEGKKLSQSLVNEHLLQSISGDEYYSSSFMRQRMGIWRVCV